MGYPILQTEQYKAASNEIKCLHDQVLNQEQFLLSFDKEDRDPFLVLPVSVPEDYEDRFREYPADMFFLLFEEIFKMIHLHRLPPSLLRLWALHLVEAITNDNVQKISIADPYLMQEGSLKNPKDHERLEK